MDRHVVCGAFGFDILQVSEVPCEGASSEGDASRDGCGVEQPERVGLSGDEREDEGDDEDPRVDGAEGDDVDAVHELGPEGDEDGHHQEGDDLGEHESWEVVESELFFGDDDEGRPGHHVPDPDHELAGLVSPVVAVIEHDTDDASEEGFDVGDGAGGAVGLGLFTREDGGLGADFNSCVGADSDEGDESEDGDEDAVGVLRKLHRVSETDRDERGDGHGDGLELACHSRALGWVVDPPDGGADGDDPGEADPRDVGGGDDDDQTCGRSWCGGDGHDRDDDHDLEAGDEGDFLASGDGDCPSEGGDVGERWCCDEGRDEEVEEGIGDDSVVELADDESDDGAFSRGDRPRKEEGGAELAGVVGAGEPGHGGRVEGEECEEDELDRRSDASEKAGWRSSGIPLRIARFVGRFAHSRVVDQRRTESADIVRSCTHSNRLIAA
jgi:hypothetical protein